MMVWCAVGEFKKTSEFVACVISGSNRQLFMMGGKLNVGGVFAASVIERKWPLALLILCFRTRNVGRGRNVPIAPPLPPPCGDEMGLENQCAMPVDFIINYMG